MCAFIIKETNYELHELNKLKRKNFEDASLHFYE